MTRIAFVVQRYGSDIIGGSEWYARIIAEKLVAQKGYKVEVFTTTAKDYITWSHAYGEGMTHLNGVTIRRFKAQKERDLKKFNIMSKLALPVIRACNFVPPFRRLGWVIEALFLKMQGPYCPNLVHTLEKEVDRFDRIYFMTYLYYPTVYGLAKVAKKAILIPTAHHEPPFFFQHVKRLLEKAPLILANTVPEKELIQKRLQGVGDKIRLAGIGLNLPKMLEGGGKEGASALTRKPYILYLGRINKAKGVGKLISMFQEYRSSYEGLRLVLAGHKDDSFVIPDDEGISYLGFVSEEEKYKLIKGAMCLVNPSPLESLSIIVVEAMMLKVPVIVNGECKVLDYYAQKTGSVFSYFDKKGFLGCLQKLSLDRPKDGVLEATKDWAKTEFSWQRVLSVFS